MSPQIRRALQIDDPVAGEACHVAQPRREQSGGGRLRDIGLEEVHANPSQPRKLFDDASLTALADSIRQRGVLQPIIVQPRPGGGYELIAGERRWRASQIAGTPTIPALVVGPVGGAQAIELALIENVAREDLGVIEGARTIAALLDELERHGGDPREADRSQPQRPRAHRPPARPPRRDDRTDRRRHALQGPRQGAPDRARPQSSTRTRQARSSRRLVGSHPRSRDRPQQ
jgi:ParB/RepB/Spo0J family partition protein